MNRSGTWPPASQVFRRVGVRTRQPRDNCLIAGLALLLRSYSSDGPDVILRWLRGRRRDARSLTESRECAHQLLYVRCLKRKPAARHAMAASALSVTDTHTSSFALSNASAATSPRQSNRLPVSKNGSTFLKTIVCRPAELSPILRLLFGQPGKLLLRRSSWALLSRQ
jgi:hypothetical protein